MQTLKMDLFALSGLTNINRSTVTQAGNGIAYFFKD